MIGGVLWIAGGAATWRLRGRLGPLLAAFVALYLVLLVGLWYLAPHFWGPRYC